MDLPNQLHCLRCGNIVETDDHESIANLVSGIKGINVIEGITIHFSFCLNCKTEVDCSSPEMSVSQRREHTIQ